MPNDLRNITTRQLFMLKQNQFEQYHNTLKHLVPKPTLKGREATPIGNLTFGEVIAVKRTLSNPNIEDLLQVFCLVFNLKRKQVLKARVIEFYHAFNWLQEQLISINKREQKELKPKVNDKKLKDAGIDEFNELGEMKTLIEIGKMFSQSPKDIADWYYSLIFSILKDSRIDNDVSRRYNKILSRK